MSSSEHSPQQQTEHRPVVAVIDDNAGLRQMLALALETAGFAVREATTEIELQRVLAHIRPDALVVDLQRSEADGLQLVERLRARPSLRDVPILFLSGSDVDDFRRQAHRAGADWFGLRPLGMLELQCRVAELIGSHRTSQGDRRKRVS